VDRDHLSRGGFDASGTGAGSTHKDIIMSSKKPSKAVRTGDPSNEEKELSYPKVQFDYDGRDVECYVIPHSSWIGDKQQLTWGLFEKFVPVNTELVGGFNKSKQQTADSVKKEVVAFWKCQWSGCTYCYMQKSGDVESKDVRSKIVQHLQDGRGHLAKFYKRSQSKTNEGEDDTNSIAVTDRSEQEKKQLFVRALLRSGLPHTPLTRKHGALYDYFKENGLAVCSSNTFVKYATEMTNRALISIYESLRPQLVHITMDSTPAKDTRNFITVRLNFISTDSVWKDIHFGVMIADGVLNEDDYINHLTLRFEAFDMVTFDWTQNNSCKDPSKWISIDPADDRPVVVGGTSDMGPAFRTLFGPQATGCDTPHGQNNISKDAVAVQRDFRDATALCNQLCKSLRQSCRKEIKSLGKIAGGNKSVLTIPPKSKKIRWGASSAVAKYVVDNFSTIEKLPSSDKKVLASIKLQLELLKTSRRLLSILDHSQTFLQAIGPCDAFVIPIHMIQVMSKINALKPEESDSDSSSSDNVGDEDDEVELKNDEPWPETLEELHGFYLKRFHRRFFFGLLNIPSSFKMDRSRKVSFFDNDFVSATWALLPGYDFKMFVNSGLMNKDMAAKLRLSCEAALLKVHRTLDPGFFKNGSTGSKKKKKSSGALSLVSSNDGDLDRVKLHATQRDAFRTSSEISQGILEYERTMYIDPKAQRETLLRLFMSGGPNI